MNEPPEIVYQLLREAWKRGADGSGVRIYHSASGNRWCAEMNGGRTVIGAPQAHPRNGVKEWKLWTFPAPRKPISDEVIEVEP